MTANRRVVHTLVFVCALARGSSGLAQSGSSAVPAPDRAQFGQSTCKPWKHPRKEHIQ